MSFSMGFTMDMALKLVELWRPVAGYGSWRGFRIVWLRKSITFCVGVC
jgi:hypothetical protein